MTILWYGSYIRAHNLPPVLSLAFIYWFIIFFAGLCYSLVFIWEKKHLRAFELFFSQNIDDDLYNLSLYGADELDFRLSAISNIDKEGNSTQQLELVNYLNPINNNNYNSKENNTNIIEEY